MNKFPALALFAAMLAFISCAKDKDKLTANTLVISLDTASVLISTGAARTLTAICKSANSSDADIAPEWTVGSGLGSFNPAKGKKTVFTAGSSPGSDKIYAAFSGVSCFAPVTVTSAAVEALTLTITPASASITAGATQSFTATCKNSKNETVNIAPSWSVDNSLGSFSRASGLTTVFTAGTTSGSGSVYATIPGARAVASVTVTAGTVNTSIYGLYSETYVSPGYVMLKYDTANPPDADGGCMGASGGCIGNVSDATGAGEKTEGSKGLKCSAVAFAGGVWLQFGSDSTAGFLADARVQKDMSAFSGGKLKFSIKMSADVTVTLEWGALGAATTKSYALSSIGYAADNNWHSVVINLSDFTSDLTKIQIPLGFSTGAGTVFYMDNARWEK